MRDQSQNDDALGERLGRILRASERLSDSFERDLVQAIRRDTPVERGRRGGSCAVSWWRTPVPLRLSPLAGLALAASLIGVAVLGGVVARSRPATTATQSVAQVVHDTVHVVRFVFVGDAKTV